jgi:hypothetical protein
LAPWRAAVEDDRRVGGGVEIKVVLEVTKNGDVFADVGSGIGPAIGSGIEASTAEEVVFNKLGIGVGTQHLMVYVSGLCIRADDNPRYPDAVAQAIH